MDNHAENISRYLKWALWSCLYLILFTPLLLGSMFVFPFITLKTIFFRILVEVAIFLYVSLAIFDKKYWPRFNCLSITMLIFGLILIVTTITGVNPYKSFWGTIERGEGLLTVSHLIFYFFILSQMIKKKQEWTNFLTASLFVSLIVGLYATAQKIGMSWVIHAGETRLSSTLGNAAYLGGYALGNFWLAILLIFSAKKRWWQAFLALFALFEIYILFETQTRGAIIGLATSIFVIGLLGIFCAKHQKIKMVFLALTTLLILLCSFVWFNRNQPWIRAGGPFVRIVSITRHNITVESRLYAWDSSWQAWKDRFLLGYGWENYNVAFNRYFHAEIYRDQGSQVWFDRAHNTIFDIAIGSGIIGLLAYLAIYAAAAYIVIKKIIIQNRLLFPGLAAFAFLVGHFIQNIFVFDSHATYIMLFTIWAVIAFWGNKANYQEEKNSAPTTAMKIAVIGVFILSIFSINYFNWLPAMANHTGLQAMKTFYQGNPTSAAKLFITAINMSTYQTPELRQKYAENIISRYGSAGNIKTEDDKKMLSGAILEIKKNIVDDPLDARNYLYLMSLYNNFYSKDAQKMRESINIGKQTLELTPDRQQAHFEIGRSYLAIGDIEEGLYHFKKAVDLNPLAIDSCWNLFSAYQITGNTDKAEALYAQMLDKGLSETRESLERLAGLYGITKNYDKLKDIYGKLIEIDPLNVDYWTKLAIIHKNMGDLISARNTAERIRQIKPEVAASVDEFLNNLK